MNTIPFASLYKKEFHLKNIRTDFQFWRENEKWSTPSEGRINTAIMMVLSKNAEYRLFDGGFLKAFCGDVVLIPQGAKYTCCFHSADQEIINCRFQGVPRTSLFLGFNLYDESFVPITVTEKPQVIFSSCTHDFYRSFVKLCKIKHRPEYSPSLLASEAMSMITAMSGKYDNNQISDSDCIMEAIINYIHDNLDTATSARLSEISSFSPATLRRKFSSQFGITPTKYINSVKIEKAKTLFESGITKVKDVSKLCGFTDEYYFSRIFSRSVGTSPTEYCKKIKNINR